MKHLKAIAQISYVFVQSFHCVDAATRFQKSDDEHKQYQLEKRSVSYNRHVQSSNIKDIVESAANDIRNIIIDSPDLAPKFLRLGFHDCVGGCDGCVDLSNADNNGLNLVLTALQPVENDPIYVSAGLTRADIWAIATIEGVNFAHPNSNDHFSIDHYGRSNCEDFGTPCLDSNGIDVGCNRNTGPHRELPGPNMDTEDVFDFFNAEFGFTDQEIVALMGAHTIGEASQANSGFNGPQGWVNNKSRLDNAYYREIVGDNGDLFDAPNWNLREVDNTNFPSMPNRFQWERGGNNGNEPKIMLNSDVALVRTFGGGLNKETGEVSCRFKNNNPCPAARSLPQMGIYVNDNDLWLDDFKAVLEKMVINGYTIDSNCNDVTCVKPVDVVTLSPETTPTKAPSASPITTAPTKAPSSLIKVPTPDPFNPTKSPSESPVNSNTNNPTSQCRDHQAYLHIEVLGDENSKIDKNKFKVFKLQTNGKWKKFRNKRINKNQFYEWGSCQRKNMCYRFKMWDTSGDGMCCEAGNGYYKISFNGFDYLENFSNGETSITEFGNCDATRSRNDDDDYAFNLTDDDDYEYYDDDDDDYEYYDDDYEYYDDDDDYYEYDDEYYEYDDDDYEYDDDYYEDDEGSSSQIEEILNIFISVLNYIIRLFL